MGPIHKHCLILNFENYIWWRTGVIIYDCLCFYPQNLICNISKEFKSGDQNLEIDQFGESRHFGQAENTDLGL